MLAQVDLVRGCRRQWPRIAFAALLFAGLGSWAARADDPPLNAATLKKVKAATVLLQVKLHDGRVALGSGFFTDEPGLIVTNAQVLQMFDVESRKPLRVDVTLTDADGKTRTLTAEVIGVDRGSDLGLVRVDDKNLPAPLPLGTAKGMKEGDPLHVFALPLGKELGKETTVTKATFVGLRQNGFRMQLEGGLNTRTSGGPVIDGKGNVVGVTAGGVRGSNIGFVASADAVVRFLNGRIISIHTDIPYKDGDQLKMPVSFDLIDPLGRLKKVELHLWAGNQDGARLAGIKESASLPGDGPKQRHVLKYEKKPTVSLDVTLPALANAKQVYLIQPVLTNGSGQTQYLMPAQRPAQTPLERRPVLLKYRPPVNGQQTAELVSVGSFRIRNQDGDENSVTVSFRGTFTEMFGKAEAKVFPMRLTYDRFVLGIKVDDKPLPGDAELRKALADIRSLAAAVEMDRDGSVSSAQADLSQVPKTSKDMLKDVSEQFLHSLEVLSIPLPEKQVKALETWKAQRNLLIGSSVLAVPAQSDIEYSYLGVQPWEGKDAALIGIRGRVKGRRGDGLDVGGSVTGKAYISLASGEVLQANITIKADCDLTFAKKPAKATGTLDVSVRRPAPQEKK